ncbi:hypothetical protein MJO29_003893 [Puccinia striiformis f. sp. tritici]|uniref:SAM domain-containing protein n=1 Tax=Puccinia striiformis f. sp. tritici PST-78 TaxID=1165861 RepID=A0A0L0VK44_9BASI|nr:hypothetical protein Pst134EA_007022 [Puccinia striiformis f. sp. tritici]KAH9469743.1 hypothetical protein Pst134EA_007022 [Puccinia striiformis f. sp. tritici]KAI7963466.1 hypothetical protein MJO29_003893 [Puccinia striiformis f. sp. tritici]KNE99364.1 hypothetical protein PSTG_07296 [Puccinia striiformis f. sp. tritici PST-78]
MTYSKPPVRKSLNASPTTTVVSSHESTGIPDQLQLSRETTPDDDQNSGVNVDQVTRDSTPDHEGTPIKVNISFKLFVSSKNKKNKKIWVPVSSSKEFPLKIVVGTDSFDNFRAKVATACDEQFPNTGAIIMESIDNRVRPIYWNVSIPRCPDWKKSDQCELKDDSDYNGWLNAACEIGRKDVGLSIKMPNPADAIKRAEKEDLLAKQAMRKEAVSASKKRKAAALDGDDDGGGGGSDSDGSDSEIDADEFDDINFHMKKIYAAHPPNSLYDRLNPVYIDPANPRRYILLTVAAVQDWAKALMDRKEGVGIQSPPSSLPYLVVNSSKRSKLERTVGTDNISNFLAQLLAAAQGGGNPPSNHFDRPPLQSPPNESDIEVYLEWVGVRDKDAVLEILVANDIFCHKMFRPSGALTRKDLLDLGLTVGNVSLLIDNLDKYDQFLSS